MAILVLRTRRFDHSVSKHITFNRLVGVGQTKRLMGYGFQKFRTKN